MTNLETISKFVAEIKEARAYFVKAQGHQYEQQSFASLTPDDYIDLTIPGEDRWIQTIIQTVDPTTNPTSKTAKWLRLKDANKITSLCEALEVCVTALNNVANGHSNNADFYLNHTADEALQKAAEVLK